MKKLILLVVMAVTMLVGCGNKPKTLTEAELVGYWSQRGAWDDAYPFFFEIEEGGEVYYISGSEILPDEKVWFRGHDGTISYGDDVRYIDDNNNQFICTLSADGNTLYGKSCTGESVMIIWTRFSQEQYDELEIVFDSEDLNGNEE